MKALVRYDTKPKSLDCREITEPLIPKNDWVKVKVGYCTICASDITMLNEDMSKPNSKQVPPVVPGHEGSGTIVEIGSDVKRFNIGDRVVYETTQNPCGECEYCKSGNLNMCEKRDSLGSNINGSFAEYVVCSERCLHKIDDDTPLSVVTLAEPLAVCVHMVEEMGDVKKGDNVVIIGNGPIGLLCGYVAKKVGANVMIVGTGRSQHRIEFSKYLGLTPCINGDNLVENVKEFCNGKLADVAIEAVGRQSTFNDVINITKKMGKIIVGTTGKHNGDNAYEATINRPLCFNKQLSMIWSYSSRPSSWNIAVEYLNKDYKVLEKLISKKYKLEDWEEAFEATRNADTLKIEFEIGGEY